MQSSYFRLIKFSSQKLNSIVAFTDYHTDIEIDGIIYASNQMIKIDRIENNITFNPSGAIIVLAFDVTQSDIIRYKDYFHVEIYFAQKGGKAQTLVRSGKISSVRIESRKLIVEVNSIIDQLNNKVNCAYSSTCRASFGDMKCKINPEDYMIRNVRITSVSQDTLLVDLENTIVPHKLGSGDELKAVMQNGYIIYGKVRCARVLTFAENRIKFEKIIHDLDLGENDIITLQGCCDKTFAQCKNVFKNQQNFRGETIF